MPYCLGCRLKQMLTIEVERNPYTSAESDVTSELSLSISLKTLLEKTITLHGHSCTIIHEARRLNIGRPDFVVKGGSFPIGA